MIGRALLWISGMVNGQGKMDKGQGKMENGKWKMDS